MGLRNRKSPLRVDVDESYVGVCHGKGLKMRFNHFTRSAGFGSEEGDCEFGGCDDGIELFHCGRHFEIVR